MTYPPSSAMAVLRLTVKGQVVGGAQFLEGPMWPFPRTTGIILPLISLTHETTQPVKTNQAVFLSSLSCILRWSTLCLWSVSLQVSTLLIYHSISRFFLDEARTSDLPGTRWPTVPTSAGESTSGQHLCSLGLCRSRPAAQLLPGLGGASYTSPGGVALRGVPQAKLHPRVCFSLLSHRAQSAQAALSSGPWPALWPYQASWPFLWCPDVRASSGVHSFCCCSSASVPRLLHVKLLLLLLEFHVLNKAFFSLRLCRLSLSPEPFSTTFFSFPPRTHH